MAHSMIALTHFMACRSLPAGIKAFLACGEHHAQQTGNVSKVLLPHRLRFRLQSLPSKQATAQQSQSHTAASCAFLEASMCLGYVHSH